MTPEVPLVAANHRVSQNKHGMVVFRGTSNHRLGGNPAQAPRRLLKGAFLNQLISMPSIEPGHERYRSGTEEKQGGQGTENKGATLNQDTPEVRSNHDPRPEHQLHVVPRPGREADQEGSDENDSGRPDKGARLGAVLFTNQQEAEKNGQRECDAEVPEPEANAPITHPTELPPEVPQRRGAARSAGDKPSEERHEGP